MWLAPLPDGYRLDEPVRLSVTSELNHEGRFGKEWLVVTPSRLLVLANGHGPATARLDVPLSEVSEPSIEQRVGGGAFRIKQGEHSVEVVRYTSSDAARFATAAHLLGKWLDGQDTPLPADEDTHCRTCGLPLEPGSQVCPRCVPKGRALKRLVGFLKPYRWQASGLFLLAALTTGLSLVPPYLTKPLLDGVLAPEGTAQPLEARLRLLGVLIGILVTVHILLGVLGAAMGWLAGWLGNAISHDVRCQLYDHLQHLSLRFYDKRQIGSVVSRVNQDTSELQRFLVWGAQDLGINLLLLVGIGIVLFVLNPRLALFVLIPGPLLVLMSWLIFRRIRGSFRRFFHRWGRLNTVLNETMHGLRVIKAFAQERREVGRFRESSQDLATTGTQVERTLSILFSGTGLVLAAGALLIYYVGGRQVLYGVTTAGTLMAYVIFVQRFYEPLRSISFLTNWASRSLTAAERIFEVMDQEPELADGEEAADGLGAPAQQSGQRHHRIDGKVTFRDITFGYDRSKPVLQEVNFTVEPGEMIGLVGASGAGKTTTINLICRFYEPDEGQILIDDIPAGELELGMLRRQIGMVLQDTFLFSGTIAENIAYAHREATLADIVRAAKVANAHEFIMTKPDGYETLIGEGGHGLSGGERQRLSIARAVLHDPRVLILDEATSHVDVETEQKIQEAIGRLVQGRTTFAIAHRLATLKNADRLFVLKDGKIVEQGTHDELLAMKGEFHKLVKTYREISRIGAVGG